MKFNFNFNKTPDDPKAKTSRYTKYKPIIISLLFLIAGIMLGKLGFWWKNKQAKQQEQPPQTENSELPEYPSTPTPQPSPEPPIQQPPKSQPEGNQNGNQPAVKIPINPSEEQMNCLRYGGGAACFADNYQPLLPQPKSDIPKQLPPIIPDIPNFRLDDEPDVSNIAIAVISGREVPDWTPDYNLPPMSPGVCPPSWVISYQEQLFCNRRRILQQSQPVRRFRRFGY